MPRASHTPGILFATKSAWHLPGPGQRDWYERMFIHPKGNIGIGTINPGGGFNSNPTYASYSANDRVLTVHSETNVPIMELSRAVGSLNNGKVGALYFTNASNQGDAHAQVGSIWVENAYIPANPLLSGGRMVFMTKGISGPGLRKMIFDEFGNLSIGLTAPNTANHRLAVEGTIGARKVKVTQETWADFVFRPGYVLPSLPELEAFIAQHQHLPDIPSEKEVLKDGVDLGEMNKKLLQKVEELTLHLIELNKRVKSLEEALESK